MPLLKRATQKLRDSGIEHLVVQRGVHGPYLLDPRYRAQRSRCHKTWQETVAAAVAGERPTILCVHCTERDANALGDGRFSDFCCTCEGEVQAR